MNEEGIAWFNELKRYAAECRGQHPLVERSGLSLAEEMQCRIIRESLVAWLDHNRLKLFQEGTLTGNVQDRTKAPFLIFTSSQPGLIADREILGNDAPNSVFLYPSEFEEWKKTHPDDIHQWHVHFSSNIGPPGPWHLLTGECKKGEEGDEYHFVTGKSWFDKNPAGSGELYWVHEQRTVWGPLHRYGGDRLWKWNGTEAVFLRNLGRWVS